MEYRILGRTGIKVSLLAFGGIPIQRVGQAEVDEIFALCRDIGINFVDTARGYTDSEEKIGKAIEGHRSEFFLASKSLKRDAKGLREDLETCLSLLKTDYVDLYQLHNVSTTEMWSQVQAPGGALEALFKAQQQGLVRHIGISSHNSTLLQEMVRSGLFDTAQFPLNAVEDQFIDALRLCKQLNLGSIAMKPLAGGSFSKPNLALRYLFNQNSLTTVIPGMDSAAQLRENYAALLAGPLTSAEEAELKLEAQALGNDFCRRCEYCLPCPQGIRIPNIFIFEGYVSRYGLVDWARERYWALPAHGDSCADCGLCEQRCPYNLPIREKLQKAHAKFEAVRE